VPIGSCGARAVVKIVGAKEHAANLRRIAGPEMIQQVGAALFVGGQMVETEAELSITRGSVSGKGHVPSAPGDPPNRDTGLLDNSIETVQVAPLKVEVTSNAPYSRALEFGTSKMAERPFMRPALQKKREEVQNLIRSAVAKVASGGRIAP
jgi:HK97 gp10 family phage protein